jgi:hypothetical protein
MNLLIGETMNNILPLSINPSIKVEELKKSEAELALAATLSAYQQWRVNKKKLSEPVPDELCQQIFSLETFYPAARLRRLFNLSTRQYETKRQKFSLNAPQKPLIAGSHSTPTPPPPPQLCQVKLKTENPYALEALPSAKTLVVEFCRSDGQIMKIHTTQDSIPTLMRSFLGE